MKSSEFLNVEMEIQQEKAEALGRVGERLERALRELETFRRDFMNLARSTPASGLTDTACVAAEIGEMLARYTRLREEARQLRYCLIIQREAVGLWSTKTWIGCIPCPRP